MDASGFSSCQLPLACQEFGNVLCAIPCRPVLEEVVVQIFADTASLREMAQSPTQPEAKRLGFVDG